MSESTLSKMGPIAALGVSRPSRVVELDALRGVGALMILGFHLWPTTFFFGWTRVDLFFVLSGYLITSIALKFGPGRRPLLEFWARRALRLLPAYYVMLAALCITMVAEGNPPRLVALISHLTLSQDLPRYWFGDVPRLSQAAIHIWSLSIEVQFYLVWPTVVVLAGRSWTLPFALWLLVNSVTLRLCGLYPAVALARCDGLALGTILAIILSDAGHSGRHPRWLDAALVAVCFAALLFVLGPAARFEDPIAGMPGCGPLSILAINLVYASLVGLVICHTGHRVLSPLRGRVLCYLGRISYGIYLYHLLIMETVTIYLGPRTIVTDAVSIMLSVLTAAISWEFLERPVGDVLKRRGGRTDAPRAAAVITCEPARQCATSTGRGTVTSPGSSPCAWRATTGGAGDNCADQ